MKIVTTDPLVAEAFKQLRDTDTVFTIHADNCEFGNHKPIAKRFVVTDVIFKDKQGSTILLQATK